MEKQTMEFLKGVYTLWKDEPLPDQIKDEVESEVGILIFKGVMAISATLLDDQKNEQLQNMLEKGEPMHTIVSYLEKEIPYFELLVKDVGSIIMKNLKDEK